MIKVVDLDLIRLELAAEVQVEKWLLGTQKETLCILKKRSIFI